jgi:hypothetical protein
MSQLYLDKNRFRETPGAILKLCTLKTLSLAQNQISIIPAEVGRLSQLRQLHVYGNQLEDLPAEIGGLSELVDLYSGQNGIRQLPRTLCGLSQLMRLHLWGNRIEILPPCIGELAELRVLNVGSNRLSALPPEIGNLSKLTHLWADRNHLASLPDSIGNMSDLVQLGLTGNRLTDLPSEIASLDSLSNVAVKESRWEDGWLCIARNPLGSDLIEAAELGMDDLRSHLKTATRGRDKTEPGEGSPDRRDGVGLVRDHVVELEFVDKLHPGTAADLRNQLERLIGLVTAALHDGTFASEQLTEARVTADRNYLQHELASSVEIDAAVVVPIAQRIQSDYLSSTEFSPLEDKLATTLAGSPDTDPRSADLAIEKAQVLAEALDESSADLPDGHTTWSEWLVERLGWTRRLPADAAAAGTGLVAGNEIATMLGATGPAGIIVGTVVAILAVVFRPRA